MKLVPALIALVPLALGPLTLIQAADYDPNSFGGSPTPIGAGARSLGMGGAFVAIADDATANTWNPAGMTQLERPEASLTAGYSRRRTESAAGVVTQDDLGVDHVSVVLPFHVGCQQTVGLAWQRQFDFTKGIAFSTTQTDESGFSTDTRTTAIDQEGGFATLGLSYAIEPISGLSFGATLFDWDDDHTFGSSYDKSIARRTVSQFDLGSGPEARTTLDSQTQTEVAVERGLSTVLGVWWQATSQVTVGMALKPRYRLHLVSEERSRERQLEEDLTTDPSTVTGESTTLSTSTSRTTLVYPTSATLGTAIRFGDMTTISLDATWTKWDEYRSEGAAGSTSPLNVDVAPSDYRDGWSFRVGLERIIPFERIVLVPRCGALYEESPGVSEAPDLVDAGTVHARIDRYYGATAGLSLFQESFIVDAAVQLRLANGVAGENAPPNESTDVRAIAARLSLAYLF